MLHSKTILVVDDEPALRQLFSDAFEMEGVHQIITAASGNEALRILARTRVDAIISDIRMPDGDGISLLDGINTNNIQVPAIIMVSGFSMLTAEEAYHRGACAMLTKPCDLETLITTTKNALLAPQERWASIPDRSNLELELYLTLGAGSEPPTAAAPIKGVVGRGGMFIPLNETFPAPASLIGIHLAHNIPELPSIEGVGVCRWARTRVKAPLPTGIGIEFVSISPESLESLSHLWEIHPTRSYIPRE